MHLRTPHTEDTAPTVRTTARGDRYRSRARSSPRVALLALLALVALIAPAACAPRFVPVRTAAREPGVEIRQLKLEWSNVFLLRHGQDVALVDTGSPGDWNALVGALRAERVTPARLRVAILTHAHADHAGLAARLRALGVPVLVGRGDVRMVTRGRNDPLHATNVTGALLQPIIDFRYRPFAPTVAVDAPVDLATYGFPGVRVDPFPGHTPGSLVVWVGARDVLVGDVMLGGSLGGTFSPGSAGEHYYQPDVHATHCHIEQLLAAGAERFYTGHGGPIDRAAVLEWRHDWDRNRMQCSSTRAERAFR